MTKHTVQMPDELFQRLATLASEAGKTTDEVILAAIQEHLEDMEDMQAIAEYERQRDAGESHTMTLDEVSRELGLDD